ncbi:MAG: class I SAM-dependent methyltransferase [Candidatus Hodarchaeales archaeon]|jgi:hypothetical protein
MSEKKFWNEKYARGGRSGRGSVGLYRNWKWNQIKRIIGDDFNSIIDMGCGDLTFWNHPIAQKILKQKGFKYLGIDISDEIIKRNQEMHGIGFKRIYPDMEFICSPAHIEIPKKSADVVFALDILFHIMNEDEFKMILENISNYTNQFLVIYTWHKNPFEKKGVVTDGISNYFRHLSNYMHIFMRNDFDPVAGIEVPYDEFGKLYIFKRMIY